MPMIKNSTLTCLIKKYSSGKEVNFETCINSLEDFLVQMDLEGFSPSEKSVNNILNFAASYEVIRLKEAGFIEMNLN